MAYPLERMLWLRVYINIHVHKLSREQYNVGFVVSCSINFVVNQIIITWSQMVRATNTRLRTIA